MPAVLSASQRGVCDEFLRLTVDMKWDEALPASDEFGGLHKFCSYCQFCFAVFDKEPRGLQILWKVGDNQCTLFNIYSLL